jgi:16S rRNA (guanine527-N7)-methyltransferase
LTTTVDGLVARYGLPAEAAEPLGRLVEMLTSDPLAPTAVRDQARVLDDHMADSLVAVELPVVRAARVIADLGAGAGVPGLPLAIALPEASVSLVESVSRKCAFMERAISAVGVANASVVCARAEEWSAGAGGCDVVTARALAPLDVLIEYAAPLLRVGGSLVAWRGKREPQVEAEAEIAAQILGMSVQDPVPVRPYPSAEHRNLHVIMKVMETPSGFPRRPGMARKRPLGRGGPASDRARR